MIKAGIIGGAGYTAGELIRLLINHKEVNIDFCRSMNRIIFDKTVDDDPETFAFVTKPELEQEATPEKGMKNM